jgi:hypothetical protein
MRSKNYGVGDSKTTTGNRSLLARTNMAQGQNATFDGENQECNGRHKRATLWLLDNLTEDAEIESFVMPARDSSEVWTDSSKEDDIPVVPERSSRLRMIRNVLSLVSHRFKPVQCTSFLHECVGKPTGFHSVNTHDPIDITSIHERVLVPGQQTKLESPFAPRPQTRLYPSLQWLNFWT